MLQRSKIFGIFLILSILLLSGCQLIIPATPVASTPRSTLEPGASPTSPPGPLATADEDVNTPAEVPTRVAAAPGQLASLVDLTAGDFSSLPAAGWEPPGTSSGTYDLPVNLDEVLNNQVVEGLTFSQRKSLADNGFAVIHSQESQFSDIRERVSKQHGQPYFLTTDAAYHAFHLTYDELLRTLEKEELYPRVLTTTQAVLDEILSYLPLVEGSQLEQETRLAAAYMSVALKLLDPGAEIDPLLEEDVNKQLNQILDAGGKDESTLFPEFQDDYSAYIPTGHYAGDEALENYFRAMTWFGRVHFKIRGGDSDFVPSRVPLIITLALRHAQTEDGSAAEEWAAVNDTVNFLVGASDDAGPVEYSTMMDQVYGEMATIVSLLDDNLWRNFLVISQSLPPPRINSTFVDSLQALEMEVGWRFMGQRFNSDAYIMQNLVFDNVGTLERPRLLPSGLDVMAALGSEAAVDALGESGGSNYVNYPEQLGKMTSALKNLDEPQWLSTASNAWLYAFLPQLETKSDPYPEYMRVPAWAHKDLNSALGSWAELKHDTVLYSKMPEMAAGGGPPASGPAPGYVEANPLVFYRLFYLAHAVADGLTQRGMLGENDIQAPNLESLLGDMQFLGDQLLELGDIASKEIQGIPLEEDDYLTIQRPLGAVEERALYSQIISQHGVGEPLEMPPIPVISAVAGGDESILQVGTGFVNRIYVIVPIEGQLQIAQGGVFSYYEFPQAREDRLTDRSWRLSLASDPPQLPSWSHNLLLPDGHSRDVLVFRPGDIYILTQAGGNLNLRQEPSRSSPVIRKLQKGEYLEILEGPVQADGFTWWNFRVDMYSENPIEGWAVENSDWYVRAWGQ